MSSPVYLHVYFGNRSSVSKLKDASELKLTQVRDCQQKHWPYFYPWLHFIIQTIRDYSDNPNLMYLVEWFMLHDNTKILKAHMDMISLMLELFVIE